MLAVARDMSPKSMNKIKRLLSTDREEDDEDEDEDEEDGKETEAELDTKMKGFEELMDRRPFLVNDVLLRRNPNDVQEWEKRVALWGTNDEKVSPVMHTSAYVYS